MSVVHNVSRNERTSLNNIETVDHNNKSCNDHKECPFYKEVSEAYGDRCNVKPAYLKGSMPIHGSDHNNNEIGDSSSSTSDDVSTNSCESSTCQSKSTIFKRITSEVMEKKKRKKTVSSEENILNFLEDMHNDTKEGQKTVLNQLKLQHDEKMKTEDAKLNLMAKLVDKIREQK